MSKLDELLRELCPDGVEYKRFDEVCTLNARIGWQRLTKAEYMSKGDYLLITGTDFTEIHEIDYSTCVYVTEERYKQDPKIQLKNGDILITKDGTLGKVAQVKGLEIPATLNGGVFVVRCKDGSLENRFILHYLLSNHFQRVVEQQKTGSTISHLTQALFSRLMIPIPPLEIQREIVRILDDYTENVTELQRQLATEMTARKTQYSFYRDKLLTFNTPVEWKPMEKEFPFIRNGFVGTVTPYFTGEEQGVRYLEGTNIHDGVISDNEIIYVSKEFHKKHIRNELKDGDILMVQSGHVGECAVVDDKYAGSNCHALIIMSNAGRCNSRFVMHYLRSTEGKAGLKKITTGGTVKHILASNMKKFMIPVPPLDVQNRIVNVLDNFERICSDLNIGLPAEIEARQKQYEYYRDKLLTFAETGNTILSRAEQSRAEQSRAEQIRAEQSRAEQSTD